MMVTRFIRPNGERQVGTVTCSAEVEVLAERLSARGAEFELEELGGGTAHFEVVCGEDDDGDVISLADDIVANPNGLEGIERVVRDAAAVAGLL